ncbi:tudor domain-containing protein 7-like isoform X1 [Scyliorhinus canicula]|uniref:tudor domain-containing protein 7-like isoform X1 n=1 Tax=Scyliorhinus canicula TaxID=7830 RepID=UPI0018F70C73|nr:tudor domain-containing protein 7-like isoform X1 [Scyliorhinus canicula]XP_038660522.1 tudor domain-containing protein 7-like isoform X1 [Scyliorhinus canicula]XP_038660523.1 tudor domain-containing protein 7-like isoform X1 [Scyliorhinus canicula]
MTEAEKDLVAKMLRAVLQSSKDGVAFARLQGEYKQLTGEVIPHKQLGFPTLQNYLESIPSVVKFGVNKNGEVVCFATVNNEIAHIAKLVARQRSPKKRHGGQTLVNSQVRLKRVPPATQVGKPKATLRQPEYANQLGKGSRRTTNSTRGKGSVQGAKTGLGREVPSDSKIHAPVAGVPKDASIRKPLPVTINRSEKRPTVTFPPRFQKELQVHLAKNIPSGHNAVWSDGMATEKSNSSASQTSYNSELIQSRLKEIVDKYVHGIWISKLPQLYRKMFNEDLHQDVFKQLERWTHVCTVEKSPSSGLAELLLYPPKSGQQQRKFSFNPKSADKKQELPTSNKSVAQGGKTVASKSLVPKNIETKQRVTELLQRYSSGLWANALPKLFEETYKMQFPQNILDDLDCLSDICTVDYAVSGDRKKAILYAKMMKTTDEQNVKPKESLSPVLVTPTALVKPELKEIINADHGDLGLRSHTTCIDTEHLPSTENEVTVNTSEFTESCSIQSVPSPLGIPAEQFPSVLVVELHRTSEAVIRYIGPEYSGALEQMEDAMKEYYTYTGELKPLSSQSVGQLVAVSAEEDSWLRAQIVSVEATKAKVFFVDHGFNEVVDKTRLYRLDARFSTLSFQAAKCKLAGLETFCKEPCVLETFEFLASGKILLMEILERSEVPLVLLYDTSGDDDFNINTACLKALHDKTLELNLKENGVYLNVVVTNVCSDGTIYCQVPSKGWTQLNALLEKVEQYFSYRCVKLTDSGRPCHDKGPSSLLVHYQQITSEYFVSLPFCGKRCLARWRGKWARVEITNVHGTRVVDILFLDTGIVASVAVSELREIPSPLLQDSVSIPPQAIKCCLADLTFNIGMWTPDAVLWLRDTVLNCSDCSIKVVKVDETKGLVHIYLFTSKNFPNPERSINHKITNADLWKHRKDVYLSVERSSATSFPSNKGDANITSEFDTKSPVKDFGIAPIKMVAPHIVHNVLPSPFVLPQPGEHMDVFISVACHPGHFVFQPWQELYKLEVLMEEMVLYYNSTEWQFVPVEKNKIFAAQLDNKWYRVLVKGILTNGLVSVYQLDYGRHELVSCRKVQTLVQQFRQLPFQAITAQLAGVKCEQWSEEASIVFRNHVERKPLVAQIQTVHGSAYPWDRRVVTYLVDTSLPDTDVWIHDLLTEYLVELSKVA